MVINVRELKVLAGFLGFAWVSCGSSNDTSVPNSQSGGDGGSSNSGGIAGRDGSTVVPPHTVSACPTDRAPPDKVGVWENITPEGVDLSIFGGMQSIVINPQDTSIVFAAASRQGVFKSTDCGATWTKVNTGKNGDVLDSGSQWSMVIDPTNPDVLYAANGYSMDNGLFKTTDGGKNWEALMPADSEIGKALEVKFVQEVAMDPNDPQHLAVTFHSNCVAPRAPSCMAVSKNGGTTWDLIPGPGKGWSEGTGPIVLGPNSYLVAQAFDGLHLTEDGGKTWKQVGGGGYRPGYKTDDGVWYIGSAALPMQKSVDGGKTWKQIPNTPNQVNGIAGDGKRIFAGCLPSTDYYVADASNDTVWTKLPVTGGAHGSNWLAYDRDHKILYSNTQDNGLWRMVMK